MTLSLTHQPVGRLPFVHSYWLDGCSCIVRLANANDGCVSSPIRGLRCTAEIDTEYSTYQNYYLRQVERNEHWRRLRDWSFCPSFCVCTRWLIIISTCHMQPAGTVAPFCENFYILQLVVMFKSLHLEEMMHSREHLLVVTAADITIVWLLDNIFY